MRRRTPPIAILLVFAAVTGGSLAFEWFLVEARAYVPDYSTPWLRVTLYGMAQSAAAAIIVVLANRALWSIRRGVRAHRGQCPSCGYLLKGLPAGAICPECGPEHAPQAEGLERK